MNFKDADNGMANIIGDNDNCQSCVFAHEMRLRGLNVTAVAYNSDIESATYRIGERFQDAFVSAKTGKVIEQTVIRPAKNNNIGHMISNLEKQMSATGRYIIGYNSNDYGHVFVAERFPNGEIVYYDPQKNIFVNIKEYDDAIYFEVLRIDRLLINPLFVKSLVAVV